MFVGPPVAPRVHGARPAPKQSGTIGPGDRTLAATGALDTCDRGVRDDPVALRHRVPPRRQRAGPGRRGQHRTGFPSSQSPLPCGDEAPRWFLRHGYVVVQPIRRAFGATGGEPRPPAGLQSIHRVGRVRPRKQCQRLCPWLDARTEGRPTHAWFPVAPSASSPRHGMSRCAPACPGRPGRCPPLLAADARTRRISPAPPSPSPRLPRTPPGRRTRLPTSPCGPA